jgi:hypothetical protein
MARRKRQTKRLPDLKIGGHTVRVHLQRNLIKDEAAAGMYIASGDIYLDASLPPEQLKETLLHECIHACEHIYGLRLPERTVRELGIGLHQMLGSYLHMPTLKPWR